MRIQLEELSSTPDPEMWLAQVRERKRATGGSINVHQILAHRDADRRWPAAAGAAAG